MPMAECETSARQPDYWLELMWINFNPSTAKLVNLNFHPLEVVSR